MLRKLMPLNFPTGTPPRFSGKVKAGDFPAAPRGRGAKVLKVNNHLRTCRVGPSAASMAAFSYVGLDHPTALPLCPNRQTLVSWIIELRSSVKSFPPRFRDSGRFQGSLLYGVEHPACPPFFWGRSLATIPGALHARDGGGYNSKLCLSP